jgi:sugar lactone lactonase YvrE
MLATILLMQAFVFPSGVLIMPNGHILVADRGAHRVFRIGPSGTKETIIGNGTAGFAGDGGLAMDAVVNGPEWLAMANGALILADRGNHRVRRIDLTSSVITTIAGNGELTHSGDGGPATQAGITNPFGLLFDREGRHLLIFDTESHTIRRVDLATGTISTVIGSTRQGFSGDGGPAVDAELYRPHNGVIDAEGRLVFGDSFNQRIRRWDPRTGVITTIAGSGVQGSAADGMPARSAPFTYFGAMVYDREGRLVFTSLDHRILAIDAQGMIRVIAGTGTAGFGGDGGPAGAAQLNTPYGLAMAPNGDLVFADAGNKRIRRIDARTGRISTIAE